MSTTIKSEQFTNVQQVVIPDKWADKLASESEVTYSTNKLEVYQVIFKKLMTRVPVIGSDMEVDLDTPPAAYAFATYVTSDFYRDQVSKSTGEVKYLLKVGQQEIPVYSTRKSAQKLDDGLISVDDATLASIMLQNTVVKQFKEKKSAWAMTPLSRISMTNEGIEALADEMKVSDTTIVKMLNMSTARKSYQCSDIIGSGYSSDFAVASILRSNFLNDRNKVTMLQKQISDKNIARCVRAAPIDKDRVAMILSCMSGISNDVDKEEILMKVKNLQSIGVKRRAGLFEEHTKAHSVENFPTEAETLSYLEARGIQDRQNLKKIVKEVKLNKALTKSTKEQILNKIAEKLA
ncbi:nucleocapsid protein [Sanxia Water Strider Virus 2]|uniref:Nucleocapsid protein n=1 Tax=Sanxia Water Strider Virus 2 TaxID=1608061 RepID=A0A1L4AB05_9VIRU|nr:nucleocapsid protein [Sanxia Water Strider Virus 2]API65465.1 nucleocapsid protein [Sanxia Water Strider Virus 2]